MLDSDTKRRIDSARQILVGKVPDPKGQVEQITTALIYKFMDDMDKEAQELGGEAKFFTGEYEKYAWSRLMDVRLGGQARLNLYAEALERLWQNKNLPALFQKIFKSSFLPFRDPETLNLFLKEINGFVYDHSERLGDAYEYLLSVLGTQGDAGQFRTPRHIIDFMVEAVNPTKDDTILDPACGTSGFLISAYKHILKKNTKHKRGDMLTPEEKRSLMSRFTGYDISPDMVRLSLVNMYLHGFPLPNIVEYDTLGQVERWDDSFNVILANPPFMTPRGGVMPHNRFSVQASRSEVLFVDYIADHLTPNGRAGVIVPEGIIFQSGKAYKQLRKMLVEGYLYAVVSLPAGSFNPYSGVKTSVLLMDKNIAKRSREIAFVKVMNDGFDLGAQRRTIAKNDLPQALEILDAWKEGKKVESPLAVYVEKTKIAESGDFNLSGDRYRVTTDYSNAKWPMVELGDNKYFSIESGGTPDSKNEKYWNGEIFWATLVDLPQNDHISIITDTQRKITKEGLNNSSAKVVPVNSIIVSSRATIGRVGICRVPLATNQGFKNIVVKDMQSADPMFVAYMVKQLAPTMESLASGGTFKEISKTHFSTLQIPLPPLEVQQQIVEELDGYQKIISGARQVVENWKPRIEVEEGWERVKIGDICKIERGASPRPIDKFTTEDPSGFNWIKIGDTKNADKYITQTAEKITKEGAEKSRKVIVGDFVLSNSMSFGRPYIMKIEGYIHDGWLRLSEDVTKIGKDYLYYILGSDIVTEQFENAATGGVVRNLNSELVRNVEIPLPPLAIQKQIVEKIEAERALVEAAKKLIGMYEGKMKERIGKVWGTDIHSDDV